jgi:hypothetical protein
MLLLVVSQQLWHEFCSNPRHVEFVQQNALACSVWQSQNVVNVMDRSPTSLADNLTHFCNIFRCCAGWSSSRMFIVNWRSAIFKPVKPV